MKRFNSLEELDQERRDLFGKFDGEVPKYLVELFDKKKSDLERHLWYKDHYTRKKQFTREELAEYAERREKEFWEENETEIIKELRPVSEEYKFKFDEPVRNPLDEQERTLSQEEIRVLVKLCENDLYLFAIRYFPHYLKRPSSRLHRFLYGTLVRETNKYPNGVKWAIAAPRASAKSTIVSNIFPLWCICYNKKRFIILLSDTLSQAEDFLFDIKYELELNEKLRRDFPNVVGKGSVWRTNEIITNNNVKILALGTGQKIRGRRFGIHRPDLVLGDDLENSEMVKSEVQRHFIRHEWFNKEVLFVGGEEGSATDFFIVGTSLGKEALLNALLDSDQYPEWKSERFRAVIKFHDAKSDELWQQWKQIYKDRFNPNRKDDARTFFDNHRQEMLVGSEVLWPEGDPYYNLMEYKLSNPSGFTCEKQNEPVDLTKIYVSEEDLTFEYFNQNQKIIECIERGEKHGLIFGALDPSLGKKSHKGDYSCIVTMVRDLKTGLIFVTDISMKRRSVEQQIQDILEFHMKFKYKLFAVETNAFQYVVAENLRKLSKETGVYVPLEEIINYQDKKMRFEGIVPFLKDGTIVFDKYKKMHNNMYAQGIDQICTFTGEGDEEDDCPDALEMCFRIAKAPAFRMLAKPTKRIRR